MSREAAIIAKISVNNVSASYSTSSPSTIFLIEIHQEMLSISILFLFQVFNQDFIIYTILRTSQLDAM